MATSGSSFPPTPLGHEKSVGIRIEAQNLTFQEEGPNILRNTAVESYCICDGNNIRSVAADVSAVSMIQGLQATGAPTCEKKRSQRIKDGHK
ncbi:hypothetical protein TNCV_2911401, partial [Trichonephila clavipes]